MVNKIIKISAALLSLILLFSLASCSQGGSIDITGTELTQSANGTNVKFTVRNNTGETIDKLKITVETYDGEKKTDTVELSYSLTVAAGDSATLGKSLPFECKKCVATDYSYVNDSGDTVSGSFDGGNEAIFSQKTEGKKNISTRAQLAEVMIDDIKKQFLSQGFSSDGNYDSDKKQLVIVSYAKSSYETSLLLYKKSPESWDDMADSIAKMSATCLAEFERYGFKDVQVSVGVMSTDDKIILSATNGEIVDMLGQ